MDTEQLNNRQLLDALDERLDRIELKLDDHLERVSKAETSINWIQGHLKVATTILLSFIGATITYFINKFGGQ